MKTFTTAAWVVLDHYMIISTLTEYLLLVLQNEMWIVVSKSIAWFGTMHVYLGPDMYEHWCDNVNSTILFIYLVLVKWLWRGWKLDYWYMHIIHTPTWLILMEPNTSTQLINDCMTPCLTQHDYIRVSNFL